MRHTAGFKYDEQKTAKPSDFLRERVIFARIINGTIAPKCAMFGEEPAKLRDERTKVSALPCCVIYYDVFV